MTISHPEFGGVSNRFVTDDVGYNPEGNQAAATQSRAFRHLRHDGVMHLLTTGNYYGRPGTTNWIAFLARYQSGDITARYGVEVTPSTQDLPADRFFIGKLSGAGVVWGLAASNGAAATSSVVATNNETALLVAELIHDADNTSARLWVNPMITPAPPAPDALLNNIPAIIFDKMAMVAQKQGGTVPIISLDELRFGETWESVTTGIPEPAMFVLVLLALPATRRR
ncbi:hypothetical protein GX586_01330 [bacterium]|nr:hypothetical protein [bacterium]